VDQGAHAGGQLADLLFDHLLISFLTQALDSLRPLGRLPPAQQEKHRHHCTAKLAITMACQSAFELLFLAGKALG
jgi:hypothetical protein